MPKRSIRKNNGFLRFQPYRAIVATPLITPQQRKFKKFFKVVFVLIGIGLIVMAAIYGGQ